MTIKINIADNHDLKPRIAVFGVGGAGNNAVNNMVGKVNGIDFWAANTDAQALENSATIKKIRLGVGLTRGLGAGSDPAVGRDAAEESMSEVLSALDGYDMIFITAGMGGGTGTGAAPVVARAAKERGILTVAVVTKPFHFEGARRMRIAEQGIEELYKYTDTVIIIPNQNLFRVANERTTFTEAFSMADDVLLLGVRGVSDLITMPGLVNLDFADIRTIMSVSGGKAMMGTGEAEGENRAIVAADLAISNPLLGVFIKGALGVIINITGGSDMTLFELESIVDRIREEVHPEANVIFGSAFNADAGNKIKVSVFATGIQQNNETLVQTSSSTQAKAQQQDMKPPYDAARYGDANVGNQDTIVDNVAMGYSKDSSSSQNINGAFIPPVAQKPKSEANSFIDVMNKSDFSDEESDEGFGGDGITKGALDAITKAAAAFNATDIEDFKNDGEGELPPMVAGVHASKNIQKDHALGDVVQDLHKGNAARTQPKQSLFGRVAATFMGSKNDVDNVLHNSNNANLDIPAFMRKKK